MTTLDDVDEFDYEIESAYGTGLTNLDAINDVIDNWLQQRSEASWSDNAFHDFVDKLLQDNALDTNRDRLIAGVIKQWPEGGLKRQTLERVWRTAEKEMLNASRTNDGSNADRLNELGIYDPAPWSQPVDGLSLADEIEIETRKFITAADHYYPVLVLWVLHSHCIGHDGWLDCSPRLVFRSPAAGCGKSTALRVLRAMCPRAMMTSSMTGAAMFRVTQEIQPTLFVDEIDNPGILTDISSLAKSGYKRGESSVLRCVSDGSDNLITTAFQIFSALALAGIGRQLDGALQSRCLEIVLHGRTAAEARAATRFKSKEQRRLQETILSRAMRWAQDARLDLAAIGSMPDHDVVSRDLDLWEPLWTIAEVIGGRWPSLLKSSLDALTKNRDAPIDRQGDILLDVVRLAYAEAQYRSEKGAPTEWINLKFTAAELWRGMTIVDSGKWNEGQNGSKGLTVHSMERALSPYKPTEKKSLSELTDDPDTFTFIQGSHIRSLGQRAATSSSVKMRNRRRAIHMKDLADAASRYVHSEDITDI